MLSIEIIAVINLTMRGILVVSGHQPQFNQIFFRRLSMFPSDNEPLSHGNGYRRDSDSPSGRHRVDEVLVARIEDRIRRGLAPPPEIYQAQYRNKIDWSRLPEWAVPLGPDIFDGCVHEG